MFRFPWGDMHSLNLGWFLQKFNELREDWATAEAGIDGALDAEIEKAEDALSDVFAARDAAAASATAAAGSASSAGTSATAAASSATAAASSATLANQKATAAGLSEAAAAQSATAASNSATAAATSATQAGNSASNASSSATAAGQSATAAAGSASAAATSETNAAASEAHTVSVAESIPEDYTALSDTVTGLTEKTNAITDGISINDKILSSNLSDRNGSDGGVTWDLVGNTMTLNGTATATRVAVWAGTSSSVPAWIHNNTTYEVIVTLSHENVEGVSLRFQYRNADSSVNTAFIFTKSGKYVITTGELVNFRIVTLYNTGTIFPENYSITVEINSTIKTVYDIIAKVIPDMTADSALVINDFRIVNGTLYRISNPIPSGGTLIPGTNCVKSTLGEIVTQILNS